ncbi:MAG: peptide ABC transporter substrate-binding protein [Cucumibacter sp.]
MKFASIMKAAALAGATAGVLAGSALAAEVPAGTNLAAEQVFRYRVLDNIRALDPQLAEDVDTAYVVNQLFEGLYNEDALGNPVPGAAESYEANEDYTVYTFHLRDAKWSNGDPVTAQDFVYGWQRAVDPALASTYAYYLGLVNIVNADDIVAGTKPLSDLGVKALDDKTLEVTLKVPTPWFVKTLAHSTLFAAPRSVVEQYGADWTNPENIVGNGSYILVENSPGERVVLRRNPNYWDNANTVIEEVQFLTINDENQGLTRWRAGEVDQTDVPAGQYPSLEAELPDQTYSVPQFCTYYASVNMTGTAPDALKSLQVRQALNLAIDRDVIVNAVLQGGQTPAYSFTNPHTSEFEMPDIPAASMTQGERDAMAQQLMAEAGYGPDNPITLDYIYNTSEAHKAIGTVIGQMWKEKLGVTLNISDMEFAVLSDRRHSQDFELARNAWCGDYNEASTFLSLHDSKSEQNDSGWANAEVDALLAAAKTSANPNEQYKQIEAIAAEEVPIMPIYFYAKVFMQTPNVHGWPFNNVEQIWYAKDMYMTE